MRRAVTAALLAAAMISGPAARADEADQRAILDLVDLGAVEAVAK